MTNTTGSAATRRAGARETRTLPDGRVVSRKGKVTAPEGDGGATEDVQDGQAEGRAATYLGVSESSMASRRGYWVPCPLPAYKGLSVLYRVSNQTRRRRERPRFGEPYELERKRRELGKLNARLDAMRKALADSGQTEDEVAHEQRLDEEARQEQERDALLQEIIAGAKEYADEFRAAECRWLSLFVVGFEGWPFDDIPQPDPDDPDSYIPLWQETEDLYFWLLDRGYEAALKEATKNY